METHASAIQRRMDVGVLGATGMVGQQFICQLADHPWFRPAWLAASERSEGRAYREAASWRLPEDPPAHIADLKVDACIPGRGPRLIFSALDANAAKDIEPAFARAGHIVITNARSFRMDPSVPLLIPEINGDHLGLMPRQLRDHGWSGAVITNPNCSTVALAMVLAPLRQFGLRAVNVTTLQAVSGAGYPGVPSMDIIGNVVPFIGGEE
jgi:aspartate-semialdehyde dehydrogenase